MTDRQLHFTAFIYPAGYHESAWRVVPADPRSVLGLPYYVEIARKNVRSYEFKSDPFAALAGSAPWRAGCLQTVYR